MNGVEFVADAGLKRALSERQFHIWEHEACRLAARATAEPPFAPMRGMNVALDSSFGAFSYSYSVLNQVSRLGRYCSIADGVTFAAVEHPTDWISTSSFTYDPGYIWRTFSQAGGGAFEPISLAADHQRQAIQIGHDVWIGTNAYVRAGVRIGDGAIIGAHAVVTKDVPPYAVVVGNPGRIGRYRFAPEVIAAIEASEWWRYAFTDFGGLSLNRPLDFVADLKARVEAGSIEPYQPELIDVRSLFEGLGAVARPDRRGEV